MNNYYEIIDIYPVSDRAGYFTLILASISEELTTEKQLFGRFDLELLSAEEFGLIDGVDDSFIEHYKKNEIFFGEISEQNLTIICHQIGINHSQVIGSYIIEG